MNKIEVYNNRQIYYKRQIDELENITDDASEDITFFHSHYLMIKNSRRELEKNVGLVAQIEKALGFPVTHCLMELIKNYNEVVEVINMLLHLDFEIILPLRVLAYLVANTQIVERVESRLSLPKTGNATKLINNYKRNYYTKHCLSYRKLTSCLIEGSEKGDIDIVRKSMEMLIDRSELTIGSIENYKYFALRSAIVSGQTEVVKYLLDNNVNIDPIILELAKTYMPRKIYNMVYSKYSDIIKI